MCFVYLFRFGGVEVFIKSSNESSIRCIIGNDFLLFYGYLFAQSTVSFDVENVLNFMKSRASIFGLISWLLIEKVLASACNSKPLPFLSPDGVRVLAVTVKSCVFSDWKIRSS